MFGKRVTRTHLDKKIAAYKTDKNKYNVARKHAKKPVWIINAPYTFAKVKRQVQSMGGVLMESAEQDWNAQTVQPSWRKVSIMKNGSSYPTFLYHIKSGNSGVIPVTVEQIRVGADKRSANRIERDDGQQHWKEASAARALLENMGWGHEDPEPIIMPDGINTDICFRMTTDKCVGVQWKSAEFTGGRVNLNLRKEDGAPGAKYGELGIAGIIFEAITDEERDSYLVDFNGLPPVQIVEVFLMQNAGNMKGATLEPHIRNPKKKINNDQFRYTQGYAGFDIDWAEFKAYFLDMLDKLPRHPLSFFRYEDISASPHMVEVKNIRVFENLLGGEDFLKSYERQNETIDVIAMVNNIGITTSVKTAVKVNNNYKIDLNAAPYWNHCDAVAVFFKAPDGTRTHVSILEARWVYNRSDNVIYVSRSGENSHVLLDRIDLSDEDAGEQVKYRMLEVKKTVDNSFEETGRNANNKGKRRRQRHARRDAAQAEE